jgi:aspartate aminotransferase
VLFFCRLIRYRRRLETAVAVLAQHGLHEYTPGGAFYMLVRCGPGSTAFAKQLLREQRVAVAPGDTFGAACANHVRVSFASSDEDVAEGVERLCRAIVARDV